MVEELEEYESDVNGIYYYAILLCNTLTFYEYKMALNYIRFEIT